MKKISEKTPLFELRQKKGWTQQQLAEEADLSVKMVSKLENGDTKIAHYALQKIAAAFGCSKAEILGEQPSENLTEEEQKLLDDFRQLSPEKKENMRLILTALLSANK